MNIRELVDPALLDDMVARGFVNARPSTVYGRELLVWKYSKTAQIESMWNEVTCALRGVVTEANGDIIARGFRKFFNFSEHDGQRVPVLKSAMLDIEVLDKADGSAFVVWHDPVLLRWCGTTTGSMESPQGDIGRELLAVSPVAGLDPAYTYMFEIISPRARCVIDYRDREELVLLGKVNPVTGVTTPLSRVPSHEWSGSRVSTFDYITITEALDHLDRPDAEGYVVHLLDTDERVKVKQDDYIALHRIIFGVSSKSVWRHLSEGKSLEDLIRNLPEEFEDWVRATANELTSKVEAMIQAAHTLYERAMACAPAGYTRAELARHFQTYGPDMHTLFAVHDRKNLAIKYWAAVEPEYQKVAVLDGDSD